MIVSERPLLPPLGLRLRQGVAAMSTGLEVALIVVGILVGAGVLLGIAQALGWLPKGWTAERFKAWFDRRKDDDER
jgi:hypothetical protein